MIIIGHPWIAGQTFKSVEALSDIAETEPTEILLLTVLEKSHELAVHCQKNKLPYAVRSNLLKDALFANALGAKYFICDVENAEAIQKAAQEYLFDTRILAAINSEEKMESLAKMGIDGVVFPEAIL